MSSRGTGPIKKGGSIAISLFLLIYILLLWNADSVKEIVEIFTRSLLTVVFVLVPTTEFGAIISVFGGFVGALISLDNMDPSISKALFVGGFIYMAINLITNWLAFSSI